MNSLHKIFLAPVLALMVLLLASCGKDKEPTQTVSLPEPKAVEIFTEIIEPGVIGETDGTEQPQTRALGPMDGLSYDEVYMAYGQSPPGDYVTNPSYTKALKGIITYGITVFQPLLFYPAYAQNAYNRIYLRGFYPREGVTDFTGSNAEIREIIANKIHYEIDGSHDILLSSVVKGSYDDTIWAQYLTNGGTGTVSENARLRYEHLLSRLTFIVNRSPAWPAAIRVKRMWVTGISNKATLNLSRENTDPEVLVFEAAHDKTIEITQNSGAAFPAAGLSLLSEISATALYGTTLSTMMIEPGAEFQVKAELTTGELIEINTITSGSGTNLRTINIKGDDTAADIAGSAHDIIKRGYHYKIYIRFSNYEITANTTIEPWSGISVGGETGWW